MALNRVHNSYRPIDRLQYGYSLCDLDLILSGGQGLVMDYPCGKFGDCTGCSIMIAPPSTAETCKTLAKLLL